MRRQAVPDRRLRFTRLDAWLCAALAAAILVTYASVVRFGFINYDDPQAIAGNPYVQTGVSSTNVRWALEPQQGNWIPLTWFSFMLESQLAGPGPAVRHVTNVMLHALATVFLFVALRRLTEDRWSSLLAAALFGLHPLRVESVAWLSERKDVLCAAFWMLTLWVYARYVERPTRRRFLGVVVAFGLSLASKPMAVMLPVTLLLLDVWPLGRRLRPALVEKIPLFALSAGGAMLAFVAQRSSHAVAGLDLLPFSQRLQNALISTVAYLGDTLWPTRLALFYPYPTGSLLWRATASAALIAVISVGCWALRRRQPQLMVGWLWYLATLLPVIGLVQVGAQARADRYTYVPSAGLFVALAWTMRAIVVRWPTAKRAIVVAAAGLVIASAALTWLQVQTWRDSRSVAERAIAVTSDNFLAHGNLGGALVELGQVDAALPHFEQATRIKPTFADAWSNLAFAHLMRGEAAEALVAADHAIAVQPGLATARYHRATALDRLGRSDEALAEYTRVVEMQPGDSAFRVALGTAFAKQGRSTEALAQFTEAVRLNPSDPNTYVSLGDALAGLGKAAEAAQVFSVALRFRPNDAHAHAGLGRALLSLGRTTDAIAELRLAVQLDPSATDVVATLRAAEGRH